MITTVSFSLSYRKRALIVCNDKYHQLNQMLVHWEAKAKKLRVLLENMQFTVTMAMNIETDIMTEIQEFQKSVENNDLLLVYYFGLCYNDGQTNYLLPTQVDENQMDVVKDNANKADRILERLLEAKEPTAVIFLLDCGRPYRLRRESAPNCKRRILPILIQH